jgi:digeranylgeranylglycerophospholipid reductase
MKTFDLIIVGASFAGLACARTAALRGLKVAVLDRKPEAGAGVRTTGILVKEAADDVDVPAGLTRRVRGIRLHAPNGAHTDHWAPGYYFLATDTPNLLRWMAEEAVRAGAHIMWNTRFSGGDISDGRVVLENLGLKAPLLIGADGAASAVARAFALDRNERFLAGVEWELAPDAGLDPRFLHCMLDSELAPGYIAWAVPGVDVIQLGLAARTDTRSDPAKVLARYGARLGLTAPKVIGIRSGLIPVGGALKRTARGPVLLIGDAAGYCSPLTGGGIALALRLGRRAAQAASDWLAAGGEHPGAIIARESPRFVMKGLMRRALDLAPPNWIWNATLGTAAFKHMAHAVYFHKRGDQGELPYDGAETGARPLAADRIEV